MKTKADTLSVKEEKFCHLVATMKCDSLSDAYRKAFSPKRMSKKTINEEACRVNAMSKIIARINELRAPVIQDVRVTFADWTRKMEAFYFSDVRKMFDEFGNPIEIPQLGDHEAMMIEGFEFVEDYTKVKKADGQTDAVPTGYTKKYKLTSKLKAMLEFGKVMGWCDGEGVTPGQGGTAPVNIQVVFVQGQAPKAEPKQINPAPQVAFVRR